MDKLRKKKQGNKKGQKSHTAQGTGEIIKGMCYPRSGAVFFQVMFLNSIYTPPNHIRRAAREENMLTPPRCFGMTLLCLTESCRKGTGRLPCPHGVSWTLLWNVWKFKDLNLLASIIRGILGRDFNILTVLAKYWTEIPQRNNWLQ